MKLLSLLMLVGLACAVAKVGLRKKLHKTHFAKSHVPLEVANQERRTHQTAKINWNPEIIDSLLGAGITANYQQMR